MNAGLSVGMNSGFCSQSITVEGVRLHARIGGDHDHQPVILWYRFLSAGQAWREAAPALAHAGMSIMIPDMRGGSDKPAGYDARRLAEEGRARSMCGRSCR